MSGSYFLKLEQFEGPLDLLLHLIKVNEIDIFNINIFILTKQYLEYLRLIKFKDLKHASDFLDMAASLIEIKSRMLLPNEEQQKADDEMEDEDPVKSLQQRLIEYEKFKVVTEYLGARAQLGIGAQTNYEWKRLEPFYENIEAPLTGDPSIIVILFDQLLKTLPERKKSRIEAKIHKISIDEKVKELCDLLDKLDYALFQGFYKKFASRYELVIYILAVLEMARWKKAKVFQRDILGPLWIYRMEFNENDLPLTREEKRRILNSSVSSPPEESAVEV